MAQVLRNSGPRRMVPLLAAMVVASLAAGGLAPPEPAAQTASADGRIAFVRLDPEGFADIWVMNADGANRTNLTNTLKLLEYQPAWAANGAQLVFVRELAGQVISEQSDLFVMDANGDNASNLTQTDANESDPAWSPDGGKIAFAGVRDGGWEILTMDPDGGNEEILIGDGTDAFDEEPDCSPDGTMLVFMKQSQVAGCCEPWEIWAVNRDGSGDTNLTNDPADDTAPSWSPDGTTITFASNRNRESDIYTMPAPTTLPPGDAASATTSRDGAARWFAAGALATAESGVQRLTRGGSSSEPDWERNGGTPTRRTPLPRSRSCAPPGTRRLPTALPGSGRRSPTSRPT